MTLGPGADLGPVRCRLRLGAVVSTGAVDLTLQGGDVLRASGGSQNVTLEDGAAGAAEWRVAAAQGGTRVMDGPVGWHTALYGLVVQALPEALTGSDRLWNLVPPAGAVPPFPVSFLGCYADSASDRTMGARPAQTGADWGGSTADGVRRCALVAKARNVRLFSLQAGNECRVGDDETAAKRLKTQPGGCGSADGAGRSLGGSLANALYRITDLARMEDPKAAAVAKVNAVRTDVAVPGFLDDLKVKRVGCWRDGGGGGIMDAPAGDKGVQAGFELQQCAVRAAVANRAVFGLEAGNGCWIPTDAGTTAADVASRSGAFLDDATCAGRGGNPLLGGADAMSLYEIPADMAPRLRDYDREKGKRKLADARAKQSDLAIASPAAYTVRSYGCWKDRSDRRIVTPVAAERPDGLGSSSVFKCAREAAARNQLVFGMQAGAGCWIPDPSRTDQTLEHIAGRSEGNQDCEANNPNGASLSMNLYDMTEATKNALKAKETLAQTQIDAARTAAVVPGTVDLTVQRVGCWRDRDDVPIMAAPAGDKGVQAGFELQQCAVRAAVANRAVFGLEAGNGCWIPTDAGTTAADVASRSGAFLDDATCAGRGGNPLLGGADAMSLYEIPADMAPRLRDYDREKGKRKLADARAKQSDLAIASPAAYTVRSYGCWKDRSDRRIVTPVAAERPDGLGSSSVFKCAREAAARNQLVFGMQAGAGCWIPDPSRTDQTLEHIAGRSEGNQDCEANNPNGASLSMNLYDMTEATKNALKAKETLAQTQVDAARTDVMVPPTTDLPLKRVGCWRDRDDARILAGTSSTVEAGRELEQCALKAVAAGRSLFGLEAGNGCWIPTDAGLTAAKVAAASGEYLADKDCGSAPNLGGAHAMSLYEIPAASRTRLLDWERERGAALIAANANQQQDVRVLEPTDVTARAYGVWQQPGWQAMFAGNTEAHLWNHTECAGEVAKRDVAVYGVEDGRVCYIPKKAEEGQNTVERVVGRSSQVLPASKDALDGVKGGVQVYGLSDSAKEALKDWEYARGQKRLEQVKAAQQTVALAPPSTVVSATAYGCWQDNAAPSGDFRMTTQHPVAPAAAVHGEVIGGSNLRRARARRRSGIGWPSGCRPGASAGSPRWSPTGSRRRRSRAWRAAAGATLPAPLRPRTPCVGARGPCSCTRWRPRRTRRRSRTRRSSRRSRWRLCGPTSWCPRRPTSP